MKKDVLLIEDSPAISLLLGEFLKKLGYSNLHLTSTGQEGVEAFQRLTKNGILPIVLLDYSLPDTNANEVISQLFTLRPDVKVVIETAEDREENVIKEAIRRGIYLYLQKPIRFENIKDVMRIIEDEEAVLSGNASSPDKSIESLLTPHKVISMARLAEFTGQNQDSLSEYLKGLASKGRVVPLSSLKEISCNVCNSVSIEQDYHCPTCNSNDFVQGRLIEHFKCGNVSPESTYENNTCPKCRKELKIIGVDYKSIDNFYTCKSCSNKFPEPITRYLCGKCNNAFRIEQAKWVSSMAYKVIN